MTEHLLMLKEEGGNNTPEDHDLGAERDCVLEAERDHRLEAERDHGLEAERDVGLGAERGLGGRGIRQDQHTYRGLRVQCKDD